MVAGVPEGRRRCPATVELIAAGRPLRLVWSNEVGGQTYEVGTGVERCFVKWIPAASCIDLAKEVSRLNWASAFVRVPRVLDQGADEIAAWIVTSGLPGENAVVDRWKADPATAVTAIGEGLRALHDHLPVETCPFSWSVDDRLTAVRRLAELHLLDPEKLRAVNGLPEPPPIDRLVVCHGDACAPNTLLTNDGRWSGHVDFGELGVADRWADLAVATWSTEWNYGPGWESALLDAYGIAADPARTRFYRMLWGLGDMSDDLRKAER